MVIYLTRSKLQKDALKKAQLKAQVSNIGRSCKTETRKKIGDANRKQIVFFCDCCGKKSSTSPSHYNKKKRHFCSHKCYSKFRSEMLPIYEHNNWKGGITKENQRGRGSRKYRNWMEQVLEKSKGACYLCGNEPEECHHIKSWVDFKEERYNPDNGAALCHDCHMKVHHENKEFLEEKQ